MNKSPDIQMKYMANELQGLRMVIAHLIGDDEKYRIPAFSAVLFVKSNYKQWAQMIMWLKTNHLTGKSLVEFFQNESPDGGGYHMGATKIISMIDGLRHQERSIKFDELI